MANQNFVFGAKIIGQIQSSSYSGVLTPMAFVVGDLTAAFVGDLVKVTGESTTINGISYPVITQTAATNTCIGVINSFQPDTSNLTLLYRPTATVRIAYVAIDPYIKVVMQMDGVPAAGDVYTTMDIVVGAGNTTTGLSGMQVNRASVGNDKQIRVLDLYNGSDNAWGQYAKVVCSINNHQLKVTTGV